MGKSSENHLQFDKINMQGFVQFNGIIHVLTKRSSFELTKGYCKYNNQFLIDSDFKNFIKISNINSILPLDGFYAFISKNASVLNIGVDHIRSYPLFYSIQEKFVLVSDNANWILRRLTERTIDQSAKNEMWLAGYTIGNKTLFKGIRQVMAGENVKIIFDNQGIKVKSNQHFTYRPNSENLRLYSKEELVKMKSEIMDETFKNMIKNAKGRPFVLPLSAGLDSRLIALQLRKHNYENVICFSYGILNNRESTISHETAKKLGFKWIFVEYNIKLWKDLYKTQEFNNYFLSSGNLCSLPHIQDWPSISHLTINKLIPNNSIIVPGHTGDFLATGHIPPNFESVDNVSKLTDEIIKKHFRVNSINKLNESELLQLKSHIQNLFDDTNISNSNDAKITLQNFDWKERQAKFIVNSIRVYEYFNLNWELPLWNVNVAEYWKNIPFNLKENKYLYIEYLKEINQYGVFDELVTVKKYNHTPLKKEHPLKLAYKKIKWLITDLINIIKKRFFVYFTDDFQWFGIYTYKKILFSKNRIQNINTFLIEDYLKKVENENIIDN